MNRIGAKHRCPKFTPHQTSVSLSCSRRRCLFMLGFQRYQTRGKLDLKDHPELNDLSTRQRINSLFENFGTNTADKLCGSCAGAVSAPFCFFGCGNSYSSKIITAPYFSIRSRNCLHSSRITLYSVHSDVPEQSSRTRCLLGQVLHH